MLTASGPTNKLANFFNAKLLSGFFGFCVMVAAIIAGRDASHTTSVMCAYVALAHRKIIVTCNVTLRALVEHKGTPPVGRAFAPPLANAFRRG